MAATGQRPRRRRKKDAIITDQQRLEFLLCNPLFDGLPDPTLVRLAAKVTVVSPGSGEAILSIGADRSTPSDLWVVVDGGLSVRNDDGTVVDVVRAGGFFLDPAMGPDGGGSGLRVEALQPSLLIQVPYEEADTLLREHGAFEDALVRGLIETATRRREQFEVEALRGPAAFLARERLLGISRLKLKRLDQCIDCDGCFEACAQRHGVSRLGDYKATYGLLGVPFNCHNCDSPGCVPACKFGHIGYGAGGEIQISDDCTGCTQCSRGCSYGSITMVPISAVPEGYLNRSDGAKGKQVARKCDDCVGYEDQACVSACPTGAIFQVVSEDPRDYLELFRASISDVERPAPSRSVPTVTAGQSGRSRSALVPRILLGICAFMVAWEAVGRGWLQGWFDDVYSLSAALHYMGWRSEPAAAGVDALRPGNPFSLLMGYLGTNVIVLSQLYRVRRQQLIRWGSMRGWFEAHIFLGYLGLIFILAHALSPSWSFFTNRWFWLALVPLLLTVGAGAIGRYANRLLLGRGEEASLDEVRSTIASLRARLGAMMGSGELFENTLVTTIGIANSNAELLAGLAGGSDPSLDEAGVSPGPVLDRVKMSLRAGWALLVGAVRIRRHLSGLVGGLQSQLTLDRAQRKEVQGMLLRLVWLELVSGAFSFLQRFHRLWRLLHLALALLMLGAMMVHIVYAWIYVGQRALSPFLG